MLADKALYMTRKTQNFRKVSAIDGYASDDSASRHEFTTFQQFLDSDGPGITMAILIRSKEVNGSLLQENRLKEVVKVSDFVSTNFKMNVSGVEKNFNQFCRGFCQANEPVRQYYVSSVGRTFSGAYISRTDCKSWERTGQMASLRGLISPTRHRTSSEESLV